MDPRTPTFARRRRGSAMVYVTVSMTALLGFASLAVDLGHVFVVRSELQLAADAAARYAAAGMGAGIETAEANAIDAANDNKADGTPVDISAGDVEFGVWNPTGRTFTKLVGPARSAANAVRVTTRRTSATGNAVSLMFARVLGPSACNVTASAVARKALTPPAAFTGLSSFQAGNNALIAGYDSTAGAPGGNNTLELGNLGSNGSITVGNNSDVRGSVSIGPSGSYQQGNNTDLSGSETELNEALAYAPTESPTVASSGALTVPHHQTITLPAGTYNYTTIDIGQGGTLTFSGPAKVYVTEALVLGNDARLAGSGDSPTNLSVRLVGGASVEAGNNATVVASVYGPQASFEAGNNFHLRGTIVARTVSVGNNVELYYDRRLGSEGGAGIMLVR